MLRQAHINFRPYSAVSIVLHWLMALLIIVSLIAVNVAPLFGSETISSDSIYAIHFTLGIIIFFLVIIRFIARLIGPKVKRQGKYHLLVFLVHSYFYLMMFMMPILGYLMFSSYGNSVPFFIWQLPPLPIAVTYNQNYENWHVLLGTISYYLIGLHTLVALLHHYYFKDPVFQKMSLKSTKSQTKSSKSIL